MTKEEKPKSINFDSLSVILFTIMLILAIARILIPGLLPLLFQISFAAVALLTSFIYFQRARLLSVSYHTPFSDTLVILAGFYLMLVLLTPLANLESPALIWAVVLVVLGVIGRLILLDSIIKTLFSWSRQLLTSLFGWMRGPYNLVRVILLVGGLFLIMGSTTGVVFVLSVLLGYIMISLSVLLTLRTSQEAPFYLRILGLVVVVYLVVNGLRHLDDLEIMVGSFLLAFSLVPWVFGTQFLNSVILAINDLVVGFYNFVITSMRSIYNYIRNNKLTILRFISAVTGFVLVIIGLAESNYLLFVGLSLIILAFVDHLYRFVRQATVGMYHYIQEKPRQSLQIVLIIGAIIAYILVPRQNNMNLIVAAVLFVAGISPSIYGPMRNFVRSIILSLKRLFTGTYYWLANNFTNHPIGSLQVISLIFAVFSLIFLPSTPLVANYSLKVVVAVSFAVLGVLPTVVNWFISILPGLKQAIHDFFLFFWNAIRSIAQSLRRLFTGTYRWLVYNFTNHPIGSLQVISLIFSVLSLIFLPSNPLVANYSIRVVAAVLFAVLGVLPSVLNWFISNLPGLKQAIHDFLVFIRNAINSTLVFFRKVMKNSNSYYIITMIISGYFSFTISNEQIYAKLAVLFVFSLSLSLIGNGFLMEFYDVIHRGFVTVVAPTVSFLVNSLVRLLRYKILASILAWVLLIMGIFSSLIPEPLVLGGFGRWLFILLSIILWNTADADRRLKFRNFMTSITKVINLTLVFSILAIIVLFIGMFGLFLPDNLAPMISVRLSLIMFSILIWNAPNEKRRAAFMRVLNSFTRFFNVEVLFNIISFILLLMGIFSSLIPEPLVLGGYGRWLFILLAIIVFNTATEKRRVRFFRFVNKLFSAMFNNIFILGFFILGLGFLTISFGIIFQGTIGFVSDLFGQALENPLVKWIIGLFMAGIGVVTIQQAFSRRADLQLSGGKAQ